VRAQSRAGGREEHPLGAHLTGGPQGGFDRANLAPERQAGCVLPDLAPDGTTGAPLRSMSANGSVRPSKRATAENFDGQSASPENPAGDTAGARLRLKLLGIDPGLTSLDTRGFEGGTPAARTMLERHATAFVDGFNIAVAAREEELAARLRTVIAADRGFAYEGSAMALALLDSMSPRRRPRLARLLESHGRPHRYMLHVGAGWALAAMRRRPGTMLRSFDPFIRWLAVDGYGFHEGFFHTRRSFAGRPPLRRPRGYEQRAFDQGLGRSLWFVAAADVDAAADAVARLHPRRRADLWSGLGLAAAYTTVAPPAGLERLVELAGSHAAHVVQGAAFAVSARHEAGNVVAHTRVAAELLCGRGVEDVAELVDHARAGLWADRTGHAYEEWRSRIRERLARMTVGVA